MITVTVPETRYRELLQKEAALDGSKEGKCVAWLKTGYWATAGTSLDLVVLNETEIVEGLMREIEALKKRFHTA